MFCFFFFFYFYCLASPKLCLHILHVLLLFYILLWYAVGIRTGCRCVRAPTRGFFSSLSAHQNGRVSQPPCFGFRFTALSHICPSLVAFYTIAPLLCLYLLISAGAVGQSDSYVLHACMFSSSDLQTCLLADPFWLLKVSTDPHTLARVNVVCR